MLGKELKTISEPGNLDRLAAILVCEYFGNFILRYSVVGVVNFIENYSILVCKLYDS